MKRISTVSAFAAFGLLHLVTSQFMGGTGGQEIMRYLTADNITIGSQSLSAGPSVQSDVTDTVMHLLNAIRYTGTASDQKVQEIVAMLMNGSMPTEGDLVRLNIIPQRPSTHLTTPPSYSLPGSPPGVDLSFPAIVLSSASQTRPFIGSQGGTYTGTQNGTSLGSLSETSLGTQNGTSLGSLSETLPGTQIGAALGTQTGASIATQTGSSAATQTGSLFVDSAQANVPSAGIAAKMTPTPALGDPFSLSSIPANLEPLPSLGLNNLNAVGPKPFQNQSPFGGLGTPGSTADLLSSLGTGGAGMGNIPQPLQTGIQDTGVNQEPQSRNTMPPSPMIMMYIMNPELMEGMMAENPMMSDFMMQQFMRPRHGTQASPDVSSITPIEMGAFAGLGGSIGAQLPGAGGLTDTTGTGSMFPSPLAGPSTTGINAGGLIDLMNTLGTTGGGSLATPGTGGLFPSRLAGPSTTGINAGGLMDLMNTLGTTGGGSLATPGTGGMYPSPLSGPSTSGTNPGGLMDLMNGLGTMGVASLATTGPSTAGANTGGLMDFMNGLGTMGGGSLATPGVGLSAAPATDPFTATTA